MSDSNDSEQIVAAIFHHGRGEAKKRRQAKAKENPPLHHRANTDWWNYTRR